MEILITFLLMALCLLAEGFFSGSEIGVVSADRMKLRHEAAKGSRGAKIAVEMLEKKPEWLLSTTLVGTNIAVVTNSTLATALMISLFGDWGSWLAVLLVAPLIWVFGEIVPKSIFQQRADTLTPRVIYVLRFFSLLFAPILVVFVTLSRLLQRLAGSKSEENPFTLREQIQTMVDMPAAEGDIQAVEKDMIRRMFDFSETSLQHIMVPLIDVAAVEKGITVSEAVRFGVERSHIRLPVYDQRVDRIVGVLNTLDLLGVGDEEPIAPYVTAARYVPLSKNVNDLLLELRKEGDAIAVIVDEFGGAEGIVTIEDIVEEVVEDIQDEYDRKETPTRWIKKLGTRDYMVSGRADLDMLRERLGLSLQEGPYATLSGYLLDKAHEIPKPGTILRVEGVEYTIQRSTPQVIQEVHVRW